MANDAGMAMKKISVIGLGYIGLPTAAIFAAHDHKIIGVDTNERIVNALNQGKIIIEEPYLDKMVESAVRSGNLIGKTKPEPADVFIIAVPRRSRTKTRRTCRMWSPPRHQSSHICVRAIP